MKLKIYLSEAWMCSEFSYQRPILIKIGLNRSFQKYKVSSIHKESDIGDDSIHKESDIGDDRCRMA